MNSTDSNVLHSPIKFSIKTNDLEKLKKKPDKMFNKNDILDADDNFNTGKHELSKKNTQLNLQLKNDILSNGHFITFPDLSHKKHKSPKRSHDSQRDEVSRKHRKIDESDQVIIEPETSSKLVIKALPRSVLPSPVTKEQSILQIFSKCQDGMKSKLDEKIDAIDLICKNTQSVSLHKSPNTSLQLVSKIKEENSISKCSQNIKVNSEERKNHCRTDKVDLSKSISDTLKVKDSDYKAIKDTHRVKNRDQERHKERLSSSKANKKDFNTGEIKAERKADVITQIRERIKSHTPKKERTLKEIKVSTKTKDSKNSHQEFSNSRHHTSHTRHSPSLLNANSNSYRSHYRRKSRHRSKDRPNSPKRQEMPNTLLNKDNNKSSSRSIPLSSLNLRNEFIVDSKCDVLINPENELDQNFQYEINTTSIKTKACYAEKLQKLLKSKASEKPNNSLEVKILPPQAESLPDFKSTIIKMEEKSNIISKDPEVTHASHECKLEVFIDPLIELKPNPHLTNLSNLELNESYLQNLVSEAPPNPIVTLSAHPIISHSDNVKTQHPIKAVSTQCKKEAQIKQTGCLKSNIPVTEILPQTSQSHSDPSLQSNCSFLKNTNSRSLMKNDTKHESKVTVISSISFKIKTNKTQSTNIFVDSFPKLTSLENTECHSISTDDSISVIEQNENDATLAPLSDDCLKRSDSDTECQRNESEVKESLEEDIDKEVLSSKSLNEKINLQDEIEELINVNCCKKSKDVKELKKESKNRSKSMTSKETEMLSTDSNLKNVAIGLISEDIYVSLDNQNVQFKNSVKNLKAKETIKQLMESEKEVSQFKDSASKCEKNKPRTKKTERLKEAPKPTTELQRLNVESIISPTRETFKNLLKQTAEPEKATIDPLTNSKAVARGDKGSITVEKINEKTKVELTHSTDVSKPKLENIVKVKKFTNESIGEVSVQYKDFKDSVKLINQLRKLKDPEKPVMTVDNDENKNTIKCISASKSADDQLKLSRGRQNEIKIEQQVGRHPESHNRSRKPKRKSRHTSESSSRRNSQSKRTNRYSDHHKRSRRHRSTSRSHSPNDRDKPRIRSKQRRREASKAKRKYKYSEEGHKSIRHKKSSERKRSRSKHRRKREDSRVCRRRRRSSRSHRRHSRHSKSLPRRRSRSIDRRHHGYVGTHNYVVDRPESKTCQIKSGDRVLEEGKSKSRFRSESTSSDESDANRNYRSDGKRIEVKIEKTSESKPVNESTKMSFKNLSVEGIPLNSIPMPIDLTTETDLVDVSAESQDIDGVGIKLEAVDQIDDKSRNENLGLVNSALNSVEISEPQIGVNMCSSEQKCITPCLDRSEHNNVVTDKPKVPLLSDPITTYEDSVQSNEFVNHDYFSKPPPCVVVHDPSSNINFFACTPALTMYSDLPYISQNFNNYSLQSVFQPTYPNYNFPTCNVVYQIPSLDSFANNYPPNGITTPVYVPPAKIFNDEHVPRDPRCNSYSSNNLDYKKIINQSYQSIDQFTDIESCSIKKDDNPITKTSSTSSLSNVDIDMDIASQSAKSIDSINSPKLDDEHSEKDDLSSCGDFEFDDEDIQDPFQKYADAPRPQYEHIIKTEVHSSAVGKRFEYAYLKSTSCNCSLPNPDEIRMGKAACDENCFNRTIKVECNRSCPVYDLCTNRRFQEQIYSSIEPFYCGKDKGWGVRSLSNIPIGTFVIEYVGELINFDEFLRRINQNAGYDNHFLMVIQKDLYIDAGYKGNWARFVNHSCDPNTTIERWVVNGKTRIGLFAKKSIIKDEEITIDYQFQQYGSIEQRCYCSSANCTGIMGKVNEKLQEQIKTSDDRKQKELIQRIISRKSLKEITHVSEMITVIKENCLDRDTFFSFLEVLLRSSSSRCIRTFIECGGLNVITSYLDSVSWNDWALKLLYLQCLDHFKLKKRTLIHSGYTSAKVVEYWSMNPRYISKHVVEESLNVESPTDDGETMSDSLEPTATENESNLQFNILITEDPTSDIEKQVQSLAIKIKEYFNDENKKFVIPKNKNKQIEFSNDFSANDSESKSISIASSLPGDYVQMKKRTLRKKCHEVIQKVSKDEFRREFSERHNKSLLEKNQSVASLENNSNCRYAESSQSIKQLLSNVITDEINSLKQNEQFSTMPLAFQNLDIDKILSDLNIVEKECVLSTPNHFYDDVHKSTSLSNYSDDTSKSDQETPVAVPAPIKLPPNWRFCHSESGRIYFYHSISKKTQWENPIYPWDAGDEDPSSYDFGDAHKFQVSHCDIIDMYLKSKINRKEEKERERQRKRLQKKLSLSDGDRNKIKFSREVFKTVKTQMKPYFSSSCKLGRVRSKVDLKFLCEKFADTIIGKEIKLVASLEDLELNSDVSSRLKSYIQKYMRNQGKNFKRSKKSKDATVKRTSSKKVDSLSKSTTNICTG